MSTAFEDGRRFVDLAKCGWVDPEVSQLDLIEALLDEHETAANQAIDELAEKHSEEIDEIRAELDPEKFTLEHLLDLVKVAHDREIGRVQCELRALYDTNLRLARSSAEAAPKKRRAKRIPNLRDET